MCQSSAKFTPIDIKILKPSDFIACNYDSFWWIGMIAEVDIHNGDLKIKFMHPHGPSKSFSWPSGDDYCWVPIVNIHNCTHIKIPTIRSGRTYDIDDGDYNTILSIVT